jgi:hypothetical protein
MKPKPAPYTVTVKKNLRRKERFAAQKRLLDLHFRARLAPYFVRKHGLFRPPPPPTVDDLVKAGMDKNQALARVMAREHLEQMANAIGERSIHQAVDEIKRMRDTLKTEVQDAVTDGDFVPFLDAVERYRFWLFEDDYFLSLAKGLDWNALQGDKTAAINLNRLLKRLHVGRGKTGSSTTDEEERRQKWRTKQQPRRSEISKHKKELDDLLREEDFNALKRRLAAWKNGTNTLKKTAAKEWKPKKQQELG